MTAPGLHAPWHLWVLIVFWVAQLLFLILEFTLFIIATVSATGEWSSSDVATVIVEPVIIAISAGLDIAEISLVAGHKLSPKLYVISSAVKCGIWAALVSAGLYAGYSGNLLVIIISVVLLFLFVLSTVYAGIIFYKTRPNFAQRGSASNAIQLENSLELGPKTGFTASSYS